MKKIAKFGVLALLLVTLVGSAFAFAGKAFGNDEAREALEAGDYGAWKQAHTTELTEERFNQVRERHTEMGKHREEMDAAIEEGYGAWKILMEDSQRGNNHADAITEENFDTFVAMHNARQDGDLETAQSLAEELGLEQKRFGGKRGPGVKGGCRNSVSTE